MIKKKNKKSPSQDGREKNIFYADWDVVERKSLALILILFYLFICLFTYLFINFLPLLVSAQWTLGPLEESWEFIAVKLLIAFEVSFI